MSSSVGKTFRFLTSAQVIMLHRSTIARAHPSQMSMLDSAVNSPINNKHYGGEQNIFQLAANLAEKIMKNHAYQDGNKRTALLAADMFLKINGLQLQNTPMANDNVNAGIANAHVEVATNRWDSKELGRYYESIATPIESLTLEIMYYRDGATES